MPFLIQRRFNVLFNWDCVDERANQFETTQKYSHAKNHLNSFSQSYTDRFPLEKNQSIKSNIAIQKIHF